MNDAELTRCIQAVALMFVSGYVLWMQSSMDCEHSILDCTHEQADDLGRPPKMQMQL